MTDRDLGALLERASEHLPEVDFAQGAWSAAVAERARRRRLALGTVGAVAAAGLAVAAVQLGGTTKPRPTPAVSSTTTASAGVLADGTAYAVMPLEGKEAQLPDFEAGLPSVINLASTATASVFSAARPPQSVVAVYLRVEGEIFQPVLVTGDGKQVLVDGVSLVSTNDASGNSAMPIGPRAIAGGRFVVFPQPDHVVRLDTHTGATVSYQVLSKNVEWAGWAADNATIVARSADHAWTIDGSAPGAKAVAADGAYEGKFRLAATADTRSLWVGHYGEKRALVDQRSVTGPVTEVWQDTLGTQQWAATGAFFDQTLTSAAIQRGNGPIYQGLVAVQADRGKARVLLAPESPDGQTGRFKGCCSVLGWADAKTVLYQSVGSHGRWILAWNIDTGQVYEVSHLLTGAPDDPVTPIALNVGWRY
ncbi:hypothetical protein [Pedococcus bigeumensis]|uniref:Uncharacterized protein n=1 Tax=Pedococcus bigeumensis TaxID=433644 RepID=A0A502D4B2_9MICO|nr:hypothetical protein [Pedococcus bigeumensis]TPG19600.1 hypothetical protein EAH86_03845 [Pedococcus bigeumensis]